MHRKPLSRRSCRGHASVLGAGCAALLALGLVLVGHVSEADAAGRITTSITPGAQNTFMLVKVRRGAFARAIRARRALRVSVWQRQPAGWTRIYKRVLLQHRWTHAIATRRICRRAMGRSRIALQVGMRYGEYWWNRWTRRWQRNYISLQQSLAWVSCATPNDLPPGAPPVTAKPAGPPLSPGFPPGRQPAAPPQGGAPHAGHGAHGTTGEHARDHAKPPPAPPTVSRRNFRSFYRSLKKASFSSTKRSVLNSWLRGLGPRLLRPYMAGKIIRAFSFGSDKVKAARAVARKVLRPLRAKEVNRIIKGISSSSAKVRVALMFCKGLADPANAHIIASQFSFSSSKRKILRGCR